MKCAKSTGLVFLVTMVTFVILDAVWLTLVAVPMFQRQLGPILRPEPMLGAAIALYPIYSFGLVALVVRPAIAARSMAVAATKGAVLGLTAYATFDLTNLAVIKGWTIGLAAIDVTWGVIVSAIAAMAGTLAGMRVDATIASSGGAEQ